MLFARDADTVCALFPHGYPLRSFSCQFGPRSSPAQTWDPVLTLKDAHGKSVTGVRLGADAKTLVSCSQDRTLKFYSA